jgi:hypothetical protein
MDAEDPLASTLARGHADEAGGLAADPPRPQVAPPPMAPAVPQPALTVENKQQFDTQQSTVGPLPNIPKPFDPAVDRSDAGSFAGSETSFASGVLPAATDAVDKATIKAFVKQLVKGTNYTVVSTSGDLRECTVAISKKLNAIKITAGEDSRKIPLATVGEVYIGTEPKDIETPLDVNCSTLSMTNGEAITFRFDNLKVRDTFAMCIKLFSENQAK